MKATLIVIDMQNDFIKGASPYSCEMLDKNLINRVKELIGFCRKEKIHIIYTQHSIKPDKSNAETGEPSEVRACIIGTDGWKIINEIKPNDNDDVVRKDKFDAFYKTRLKNLLKKLKADTVILCGVMTNNCVRSTAEGAYFRGYKLIIVSDCCGATSCIPKISHEKIHELTLKDLKERTYETQIVSLKEVKNLFQLR
jgi:nicotinamidase-related amidase